MAFTPELARLCSVLAELYPAESVARVVAGEAGLPEHSIHLNGSADDIWNTILSAAQTNQQLHEVIDVARRHFPNNTKLAEVVQVFERTWDTHYDQQYQTVHTQYNIGRATIIRLDGSVTDQGNLHQQSIEKKLR